MYDRVKLNEYYRHIKFDITIFIVSEKITTLQVCYIQTLGHLARNTDHYILIFFM